MEKGSNLLFRAYSTQRRNSGEKEDSDLRRGDGEQRGWGITEKLNGESVVSGRSHLSVAEQKIKEEKKLQPDKTWGVCGPICSTKPQDRRRWQCSGGATRAPKIPFPPAAVLERTGSRIPRPLFLIFFLSFP